MSTATGFSSSKWYPPFSAASAWTTCCRSCVAMTAASASCGCANSSSAVAKQRSAGCSTPFAPAPAARDAGPPLQRSPPHPGAPWHSCRKCRGRGRPGCDDHRDSFSLHNHPFPFSPVPALFAGRGAGRLFSKSIWMRLRSRARNTRRAGGWCRACAAGAAAPPPAPPGAARCLRTSLPFMSGGRFLCGPVRRPAAAPALQTPADGIPPSTAAASMCAALRSPLRPAAPVRPARCQPGAVLLLVSAVQPKAQFRLVFQHAGQQLIKTVQQRPLAALLRIRGKLRLQRGVVLRKAQPFDIQIVQAQKSGS